MSRPRKVKNPPSEVTGGYDYKFNDKKLVCPQGCQWVGELRSVARHIDPESGECTAERPCKYDCGLSFPAQLLQGHHQVCPNRPYTCQYCRSHQSTYAKVTEVHWPKCPKYPLPCPFGCGASIRQKRLEKHFGKCPKRPHTCQYCHVYQGTYSHVRDVHWPQCPKKLYTCRFCHGYQGTYANFKAVHKPQCLKRPYTCQVCHVYHSTYEDVTNVHKPQCLKGIYMYTCQFCHVYHSTYEDVTDVHWPQCPKFPLPCPNGCKSPLIRREDMKHHREACPVEIVECKYRNIGCTAKVTRAKMDAHLQTARRQHLHLMDIAYKDLCVDAEARVQAKEDQVAELMETIQSLKLELTDGNPDLKTKEDEIDELKSTAKAKEDEIDELKSTVKAKEDQIVELTATVQSLEWESVSAKAYLQARDNQVDELTATVQSLREEVSQLRW